MSTEAEITAFPAARGATPLPIDSGRAWAGVVVRLTAAYAIAGGLITLIGWFADVPRLTDWRNDGISMFPNTAVCVVLCGLGLLLNDAGSAPARTLARALGCFVALVGGLSLLEHLTGASFGIDTLVIEREWGQRAAASSMRMGPPASISFLLIGIGLTLSPNRDARRLSPLFALIVMAIAMLSITGYLYGAREMYTLPRLTGIAFQTASILLALAIGLVAGVPEREPMRTLLEPDVAGILARRSLVVLYVLAIGLGWLRVTIQDQGLVDTAFGTALRTLVEIMLLSALVWIAARLVRDRESALRANDVELRRQAEQLGAFAETAAIGLHRMAPDGTIVWVNDAELDVLGYAREEYVGHNISEFHADRAVAAELLARLHRGERVLDYAATLRCRDGSTREFLIDASLLREDGRFAVAQVFTRDMTEAFKSEETRALLAAIVHSSDDAIVSKTLEGIIMSWNPGAERIFGYGEDEVRGQPIALIIPSDRLREEADILRRLRRGERIDHYETVRRAKDGRMINVSLTVSPIRNAQGRVIGASKIARDITEQKRIEAERVEGDRRKDEFLAILAHELRNPLGPIRNAAHHLKLQGPTDPDLRRSVVIIERQVGQMARLIDDLLDVSRISRNVLELRRQAVTLGEIVDAALDACRHEIDAKHHSLQVAVPSTPVELVADRERLVQVLCNVIGNAAKYTPAGGAIALTANALGGVVEISVKDTGIGLAAERLEDIFELFTRVDHSLDRQGGMGIGLTLARQLVEMHGGTIEARSRGIGSGSEFVVRLPLQAVPQAASEATATTIETPSKSSGLRILVADDNQDAVESLALLLELGGHEVHVAMDGAEAIDAAVRLHPDAALLDIGMPKANGYEVAYEIRQQAWGREVFLVALTGWGQQADRDRAEQAGFDAHLVKPVPPEALEQLLVGVKAPAR